MTDVALASETEVRPGTVTLADCSPQEQLEQRYVATVDALVADANERRSLESLVDVFAWSLARIITAYGSPAVAGDVMQRIGNYVCVITRYNNAQAEAESAKKEGLRPH